MFLYEPYLTGCIIDNHGNPMTVLQRNLQNYKLGEVTLKIRSQKGCQISLRIRFIRRILRMW